MKGTRRRAVLVATAIAFNGACLAAGGHHAVDDAAILETRECELEHWLTRAQGASGLAHSGFSCGIGGVEIGVAGEYARAAGASQTAWGLQAKTAYDVNDTLSIGAALTSGWQARARPRHTTTTLLLMASWKARPDVALHVNVGRDFLRGAGNSARAGVAAEWSPSKNWMLLVEGYGEQDARFVRAGVRWQVEQWQVDVSRANVISGVGTSAWTLGLTFRLD